MAACYACAVQLEELLDRLVERAEMKDFSVPPAEWTGAVEGAAARVLAALADRNLRAEHRQRIHEDIVTHRAMFREQWHERLVDLVVWGEHVESLYKGLQTKTLQTFHYVRALEATCRRCGFELLPLMGHVEELGQTWGSRDLAQTWALVSPHLE